MIQYIPETIRNNPISYEVRSRESRDKAGKLTYISAALEKLELIADKTMIYLDSMKPDIKYIDMPEHLKKKYQYYTKAEMGKLRAAGYKKEFMDLEEGTRDYVLMHLDKDYLIY